MARVVEPVDVVACFREHVRVATLPARNIEDSRSHRQTEYFQQPRYIAPITFGSKERLVLEEIVGVEGRFPPLGMFRQKNTGSR